MPLTRAKAVFENRIWIYAAFALSFLYLLYLSIVTQMIVVYDALGYEELGKLIANRGWAAFFQSGPHREPLYPFLISLSMQAADILGLSYQTVQTFLQIFLLILAQFLTFQILERMRTPAFLSGVIILYIGFSPALTNSALSLFSEIAVVPILPAIVLLSASSWTAMADCQKRKAILYGVLAGSLFIAAAATKAIYIYILPVFLIPFIMKALYGLRKHNLTVTGNFLLFTMTILLCFSMFVVTIKSLNLKYNGNYIFTNRGAQKLYGTIQQRVNAGWGLFPAALATVPGQTFCQSLFSETSCRYWTHHITDSLSTPETLATKETTSSQAQIDRTTYALALKKILSQPLRYFAYYLLEGNKMFFWETMRIGFVAYPDWLGNICAINPLEIGVGFFSGILSITATLFALVSIRKTRTEMFAPGRLAREDPMLVFFLVLLVIANIMYYALFSTLPRYFIPQIPLFLALIAYGAGQSLRKHE